MSGAITVLAGEAAVRDAVGRDLGATPWFEITGQRLADFIAATGDSGGAYFAISLSNMFLPQIVEVRGFALGVNYGTQSVRLGSPLRSGDRVRGRATLLDVAEVKAGIQTTMAITIELETARDQPAAAAPREDCVIESLSRWMNPDQQDRT